MWLLEKELFRLLRRFWDSFPFFPFGGTLKRYQSRKYSPSHYSSKRHRYRQTIRRQSLPLFAEVIQIASQANRLSPPLSLSPPQHPANPKNIGQWDFITVGIPGVKPPGISR